MIMPDSPIFSKRISDKISREHKKWTYHEVKPKVVLCLINYASRHEDVSGNVGIAPSALDGGEWWASRHGRFTPRVKSNGHPQNRKRGGPQNYSGRCEEKNPCPCREPNPGRPARGPSLYRLSYHNFKIWTYTSLKLQLLFQTFFNMDI
jgi:hypothetical protein